MLRKSTIKRVLITETQHDQETNYIYLEEQACSNGASSVIFAPSLPLYDWHIKNLLKT
jgi:hypothetical protein